MTGNRLPPTCGFQHTKKARPKSWRRSSLRCTEEADGAPHRPPSEHNATERTEVRLNDREMEVLRLLVQGLANKEIAARMDISESTVKNTLQQLFAKTNVRTRAQLVRVALEKYRDEL